MMARKNFLVAILVATFGVFAVPLYAVSCDWPVLKSYEGKYAARVKMPVGGIGTGTISVSGKGDSQQAGEGAYAERLGVGQRICNPRGKAGRH